MSDLGFDDARLARIDTHFERYVDDGRLVGWQVLVGRHGQVAHSSTYGLADREAGRPVADDTLWRIYSMTKPVVSVAAMVLWEQGLFELTDEVSRFIPSFADAQVFDKGSASKPFLVPVAEPVRLWHLLSHTSGLTYGFLQVHPVDMLYREAGFEFGAPPGTDLAAACDAWAGLPLRFQPGSAWGYGVSTDVLGRVIEVVSGQPLDVFVREQVLEPLGMTDTRWWVEGPDTERLAALYAAYEQKTVRYDVFGDAALRKPALLSGGSGLVSTAADYWRFCQLLVGRGEVDGVRVLAPRTLELMTRNHLPAGVDLAVANSGGFAETVFDGIGFGLGFATVLDPTPGKTASSVGEYYWGGLASTAFWVDPSTGISAVFLTQLLPSSTYPIRAQLRQLVYSALVD
ncbi:MAG: serine hydrolase [Frankiales bacterium]|nr:serine hydrolase [Frankiales bacterium]